MISWMQKHHKYMVWTIWVAAIGFIGAGSVGWGSLHFGSKATSIAKVGDIEISQQKLNQAYSNLYNRYNQLFKGNFDDKKAQELGLVQQAFASLEIQAKLLNFAKENGIIVTDKEVAKEIENIKIFQTNGVFDKKAYNLYLQNQRLKAKDFESTLKDDLIIQKTLSLLNIKPLDLEIESISSSMNISDKIAYKVLSSNDINVSIDEDKIKTFWKEHKDNYITQKRYKLAIIWKEPTQLDATDEELKEYYEANSFNFTDNNGKLLNFDEAKDQIKKAVALKKLKKEAQLTYIALKKGKIQTPTVNTLTINDPSINKSTWDEIETKDKGEILKPKIINDKYAIIKIVDIEQPRTKTYNEARDEVLKEYKSISTQKALEEKATNIVQQLQKYNPTTTDFITLDSVDTFTNLNQQESINFLRKLFISNKEKGIINLSDNKIVVYNIVDQKLDKPDTNKTKMLEPTVAKIKADIFQANLINQLNQKYQTKLYRKGLTK